MSRMLGLFKKIGPGAIVASATIGAGETVLAVRVGAWGGYQLLWLVLLAALTKSLLTLYMMGRYSAISGRPAADGLVNFPGPRGWLLWLVLIFDLLVAPAVFVAIAAPCGRLLAQIVESMGTTVDYRWFAVLFASFAIVLGATQKYETLERSQIVVCLVLLVGTVTAAVLARPDLIEMGKGFVLVGRFPPYPDWVPQAIKDRSQLLEMAVVFGYAGSISLNYVVYSNWVVLKGWTVGDVRGRDGLFRKLEPVRWDVGCNAVLVLVVTSAFMVAGAAILNPLHRIPNGFDLLSEQAHIFSQISPAVIPLYYVTILAALWGTLNALPDIYARGAHSILTQLLPAARSLSLGRVMWVISTITLVATWILIISETRPVVLMDIVGLFSTNIGVALVCIGALWLDRQLPSEQRASPWVFYATVVSAVVISAMSLISLWKKLAEWWG